MAAFEAASQRHDDGSAPSSCRGARQALARGAAGLCALLVLRLGTRAPAAWLWSGASASHQGAPVSTTRSRGTPPVAFSKGYSRSTPSLRAPAVAALSKSERHSSDLAPQMPSFAVSAALAAGAGGAAIGGRRRRQERRNLFISRIVAAASDGQAANATEDPASVKASSAPTSSQKGGDESYLSKMWKKLERNPDLQEDLKTFFTSLTIALCIRGFLVEPRFIPSLSMYPNFDIGDQLTVDKISKNWRQYQRRDVVVFNPPPAFSAVVGGDRSGEALIKRIVALAGDTVEVKNGGTMYVNGEAQEETFTNEAARYTYGPVTVPPGCVLVLGDNRNQSLDGHVWGFLPVENIIGRATFKFWPPWHVGGIAATPP